MSGPAGDGKDEDLGDIYLLLGVEEDATDAQITTAYRKASRDCHPDKNPDDPNAALKFMQLTRAKDLLLDPMQRGRIDDHRTAQRAVAERNAQDDAKRRKLREDLEARENAVSSGLSSAAMRAAAAAQAARARSVEDWAARIKAREMELNEKQADMARRAAAQDDHFGAKPRRKAPSQVTYAPQAADLQSFERWEADMLGILTGFAEKQRAAKVQG
mmetsp:Transcript_31170/g.72636  ORF Transcript_31170/g.72636 Transcript_31170/m.72636 type:complete len:216 (+) Transcript_31170:51-698(+)